MREEWSRRLTAGRRWPQISPNFRHGRCRWRSGHGFLSGGLPSGGPAVSGVANRRRNHGSFRPTLPQPARLLATGSPEKPDARARAGERVGAWRPLRLFSDRRILDVGGLARQSHVPVPPCNGDTRQSMILPFPTGQQCPTHIDAVSREWVWFPRGDWLAVSPITPPSSLPPGDSVGTDHGFVTFPPGEPQSHFWIASLVREAARGGSWALDRLDRSQGWPGPRVRVGTIVLLSERCPVPTVESRGGQNSRKAKGEPSIREAPPARRPPLYLERESMPASFSQGGAGTESGPG